MRSLPQPSPGRVRRWLTTVGATCRIGKAETLVHMIDWVVDKLTVDHCCPCYFLHFANISVFQYYGINTKGVGLHVEVAV
jgi:hypothetical protein